MAIAPNTQEFYNLKQNVENQITQGLISNRKQLKEFLDKEGVNFDKFMEVDKEYERRKQKGTLTPDTTFDVAKVVGSAVGKVAEDIGQITGDAVEFVAGKEARKTTGECAMLNPGQPSKQEDRQNTTQSKLQKGPEEN